ncbi:hypothetical protein ONE63_005718 [Megalurothrips usitatus]|uniref:uS12 prolyl 3-hydroxylase n=1 Tax=Megalurothrips usitatus TaxID=439358 RepID=A0AAV7XXG2_9NEOP|nr:hypothetical protein ONE63_005718 [Megalurothrips usitatus]
MARKKAKTQNDTPAKKPKVKRGISRASASTKSKNTLRQIKVVSSAANGSRSKSWMVNDLKDEKFVLNPAVSSKVAKLCNLWKSEKKFTDSVVELDPVPFKHCVVKKLLKDESNLTDVCAELFKLPYHTMLNDLYSCQQSCLLDLDDSYPNLRSIVNFIKGPLHSLVQEVTGKKFSNKFTITASQYKFTDRLLCHDDNLHDRSVAFIFYLCKDWREQFGGSLDLFDCDVHNQPHKVVKSIFPSYGSFSFFEVTHNSYHQVSEVLTSKSVRLSINGWYHGEDLPEQVAWHASLPKMTTPIQPRGCSLDKFISETWQDDKTNAQVKSCFEKELSISLPKFLDSSVFADIENALRDGDIVWEHSGPANHRRYEIAKPASLPGMVSQYLKIIQSKEWFRFLSECTVEISPDVKPKPKCWVEVQRWQPGDYTVLVDNDPLNDNTGIDVHLYFGVGKRKKKSQGGEVFYLGPDRDDQGNLEQAFHLEPENNTATIIAHIEGMAVLTKYLDHRNKPFYKIFARYSQTAE